MFIGIVARHSIAIKQLSDKDEECAEKIIAVEKDCRGRLADKDAEIHKVIEANTASFLNLQARQLAAIAYCVEVGGTVSIPSDSELARELQALKRMGYSDTVDGSENGSYWFVTDKTMNALQNSEECRDLLSEAMLTGRFDFWGRYVETPPEMKDRVSGDTGRQ